MIEAPVALYETIVEPVSVAVLVYLAVAGFSSLVRYGAAAVHPRRFLCEVRSRSATDLLSSELVPGVTVLVSAHNEAMSIGRRVEALLALHHPRLEIVVVDDGSTDTTLDTLIEAFELQRVDGLYDQHLDTELVTGIYRSRRIPNLVVASKEQGGTADALNVALNLAGGELVCTVDANTTIEPNGLGHLVRPFLRFDEVVAATATIELANESTGADDHPRATAPRDLLGGIQVVAYLRAVLSGPRRGWHRLVGDLPVSGSFGLFRRDRLRDIGGYTSTVGHGHEMDLAIRLRRDGHERGVPARIEAIPDPVARTEGSSSLAALGRQRERAHRDLSACLWRHRQVLGNRRYGTLGLLVYPAVVVFEWLAPIVEVAGLILIPFGAISGHLRPLHVVAFALLSVGVGLLLSLLALLVEELSFRRYGTVRDRAGLLVCSLVESVGFRQVTLYWRLRGTASFLRRRGRWGGAHRRSAATDDTVAELARAN